MNLTDKKYKCISCAGLGISDTITSDCDACGGKGKITGDQLKEQIIQHAPNNLRAIEMIEIWGLNG